MNLGVGRPRPPGPSGGFPSFLSRVPGVEWPAILSDRGAMLWALMERLDRSQWLTPDELAAGQAEQLAQLFAHARSRSPFHRPRLPDRPPAARELLARGLSGIPVLTRGDLQDHAEAIMVAPPPTHGPVVLARSSGSTGRMVAVGRTALCQLFWEGLVLREHFWHGRDFSGTLAVTRANLGYGGGPTRVSQADWGPPVAELFRSGPAHGISLRTDVATQADWLAAIDPHYLTTYPTNLAALLDRYEARGVSAGRLKQVRSIGETLAPELRERCRRVLGVPVVDAYSAEEVGIIAAQCPESGLYHVQAENLIVEVLDDAGRPCGPGETGRVVVTDLHNFATPLIRYDLGDHAEVAGPCPCGRGLPALRRILGRSRNMAILPDGRRFWPLTGAYSYRDVAPIRQYQMVQRTLDTLVLRYAADEPLTGDQAAALVPLIRRAMDYPFRVEFEFHPGELPRSPAGKFEEFMCLVRQGERP